MRLFILCFGFALTLAGGANAACPNAVIGGYGAKLDLTDVSGRPVASIPLGKRGVLATPLHVLDCRSTFYKVAYNGSYAFVDRSLALADNQTADLSLSPDCGVRQPVTAENTGTMAGAHAFDHSCKRPAQ